MTYPDESHIYETTDDDTPAFVGIDTFLQGPFVKTPRQLREYNADVAIIGAPFDLGVVHKPGARFGPRAIRQAGYFGAPNDDEVVITDGFVKKGMISIDELENECT